ncbi:MAG: DUF4349 domain-containing protein [Fimbriimonadales bacterium]
MKKFVFAAVLIAAMFLVGCGGQEERSAPIPGSSKAVTDKSPVSSAGADEARDRKAVGGDYVNTSGTKAPPTLPVEAVRAVVRSASLKVRVESVEKAQKQIGTMVMGWGGFVENSQQDLNDANSGANMTLRIPSEHFNEAMEQISGLGLRISQTVHTDDITDSIVDMQARLRTMKAQEEAYRNLLRQRRSRGEVEEYIQKLSSLRAQIEQLSGQLRGEQVRAALPIINLSLEQSSSLAAATTGDPGWLNESWGTAYSAMGVIYRGVASLAIWALLAAPLWLPVLLVLRRFAKNPKAA